MNKAIFIFFIGLGASVSAFCQDEELVYVDKFYKETDEENAAFYKITGPHSLIKGKYVVNYYYLTDTLRSESIYADREFKSIEFYKSYFPNGNPEEEGYYKANWKNGIWKKYYENNSTKEVGDFYQKPNDKNLYYKIISYWNHSGVQTVKNGTGEYISFYSDTLAVSDQGHYNDGFKDGNWQGFYKNGQKYYSEDYTNGKLVTGTSWDKVGNEFKYQQIEEPAMPVNGYRSFYLKISKIITYPRKAIKKRIQGTVYVQFTVNKDGEIENMEILKSPSPLFDQASIQAIKENDSWIAPKQRGQNVKQNIVLPVKFQL